MPKAGTRWTRWARGRTGLGCWEGCLEAPGAWGTKGHPQQCEAFDLWQNMQKGPWWVRKTWGCQLPNCWYRLVQYQQQYELHNPSGMDQNQGKLPDLGGTSSKTSYCGVGVAVAP